MTALRRSWLGSAFACLAASTMLAIYVAPVVQALRLPGFASIAAPIPQLTVPAVSFPLLRVPHVVRPAPLPRVPAARTVSVKPKPAAVRSTRPVRVVVVTDTHGLSSGSASSRTHAPRVATFSGAPTVVDSTAPAPTPAPSQAAATPPPAASVDAAGVDGQGAATAVQPPLPTRGLYDAGSGSGDTSGGTDAGSTTPSSPPTDTGATTTGGDASPPPSGTSPPPTDGTPPTGGTLSGSDTSSTSGTPAGGDTSSSGTPPIDAVTPSDPADLGVTLGQSASTSVTGGSVTYTVTISNNGPDDARAVSLTDTIPSGSTLTSFGFGLGVQVGDNLVNDGMGHITGNLQTIAAGASKTITITVNEPNSAGTATDTASVSNSVDDPAPGNNSASIDTTVITPEADLAITISQSASSTLTGGSNTYTVTISNNGPQDALNVSLHDTIPTGSTLTSFGFGLGVQVGDNLVNDGMGHITGNLQTIAAGASKTITITVNEPSSPGTATDTASVSNSVDDPTPGNNTASIDTTVQPNASSAPALAPGSDSGISNRDGITNVSTPTLVGTSDPNVTITILDNGVALGSTTSDGGGNWTFTTPHLADGTHSLTARASLNGVASATDSAALMVTIDTTPPTVTISSPAAGSTFDVGTTFTFGYTRSDAVGVVTESAALDGAPIANGATVNTAAMTKSVHTLTVVASDAAGNTTTRTVTFTVRYSTTTLTAAVNQLTLPSGPKTALLVTLGVVQLAIDLHLPTAARVLLTAFIALVQLDGSRGLIPGANATTLIMLASALRAAV